MKLKNKTNMLVSEFSKVVLPAPDAPTIDTISPFFI